VTAAASIVVFVGRLRGRLVRLCASCATGTGPLTGKPGARGATVREQYGDISTTGMGMTQGPRVRSVVRVGGYCIDITRVRQRRDA